MSRATSIFCLLALVTLLGESFCLGQTREEKVRADRAKVEADGFWMYNDIPGAMAEAKKSGKPVLVVLRCIPCEECVKLDDDLVDKDPVIRPLLDKFVCVRQVSTNGLDLDLFQYDTDQSFAVFMLNADGTIYGRFGTRSHRTEWLGDVSLPGLAKALQGALDLHASYPANRAALAGKRGEPLEFGSPEKYPSLKGKYADRLDYQGEVAKSCIHCHQIGEARRDFYWAADKQIPEPLFFPYPHPKTVGLIMDPEEMATIKSVDPGSPAAKAGLRGGDSIEAFDGQPLLSIADIQWVLDRIDPKGGKVMMRVRRGDTPMTLTFLLEEGWRRNGDLSWRTSTWAYRRVVTGGLVLGELGDEQRKEKAIDDDSMALIVKHVGQWGAHAAGKLAGFRKGDVLISYDGREDLHSEATLIQHAITHHRPGAKVKVTVLRGSSRKSMQLPIQK